jgi:membrane protein DedA with SNARE-associated domain
VIERYGVVILPALVVAEQVGIPLPAVPALLAVGALAAHGRANLLPVLAAIVVVALTVDLGWYELGRRRGARVLAQLCRLSLEPDFCVRRAERLFERYGARGMLVAKFLPGVTTVMPPLAGIFGVPRPRFAFYEVVGVILWAGSWLAVGYVFSDAITLIAERAARLGRLLAVVVVGALAGYVLVKFVRRRLFLRTIRMARISPEALKERLDAGEDITIVDLRTRLDVAAMPYAIPGSRWIEAGALDDRVPDILRARELVLYCS